MALQAEVWSALTGEPDPPSSVRVHGDLDLLPSVFPVIEIGAAAVGAALLAAARLDALRTGQPAPEVDLDTPQLACALRSERLVRHQGQPAASGFAPISQFFRTRDGWIRLHANYPWHHDRLLRVLGTSEHPQAVAEAVARWSGIELEDAIFAAGGCAAVVRRPDEWRTHPQGAAIGSLPLVELVPVPADAPRLSLSGPLPASGIRVLDFTRVIAGPVCTRLLGALGADVLRIDTPELPENEAHIRDSLLGKRSAFLSLEREKDRHTLEELVRGADVVVQGYRPGALARFGLSPDELLARKPGLIVLSLSAWGHTGPWAGRRGFDSLVQPATGIAVQEAAGADTPGSLPCQLLDHATGYVAAAAVLTALARRCAEGSAWHARVSLAQTAAWVLRQPVGPKKTPVQIDATPYLVDLDGDSLVTPPGRLGGRPLAWPGPPPRYGADAPAWLAGVPA